MRSVLATSLLANCGLFVPCSSRSLIPEYDAYFLRTSSFDIPSEGKSSFAVEMSDLRAIMRDTSPNSLLMMDEIGRGTSTMDGAALSGAILEWMSQMKCHGIFSTHILELVRLPLKATLRKKRMGVQFRGKSTPWLS
jgi:DNA mismatch repair ATPase MutS